MSSDSDTASDKDPQTSPGFGHVTAEPWQGGSDPDPVQLAATNDPTSLPNQQAERAAKVLLQIAGVERVDLACTLGSGWGEAAEQLGELVAEIDAEDIPGFHTSGVPGHSGSLKVIKSATGAHVLVIGARTHYYEGRGVDAVAHGVRTAAAAGAGVVVLTNGCGGLNPAWSPGTPVLISDHLNLTGVSPLRGAHFVDLTDLYSPRIRGLAKTIDPSLDEGVYAQLPGPHYETPAEIRYLGTIGADLVGMSTTLEAIAARAAGMEVFGVSLVTNLAAGITPAGAEHAEPLSHQEVIEAGQQAAPRIAALLAQIITSTLEEG